MQQITGILFDKDGTLFDFQATWGAWAQSFLLEVAAGDRVRAAELGAAIGYRFEAELFEPDSPVIAAAHSGVREARWASSSSGTSVYFLR